MTEKNIDEIKDNTDMKLENIQEHGYAITDYHYRRANFTGLPIQNKNSAA